VSILGFQVGETHVVVLGGGWRPTVPYRNEVSRRVRTQAAKRKSVSSEVVLYYTRRWSTICDGIRHEEHTFHWEGDISEIIFLHRTAARSRAGVEIGPLSSSSAASFSERRNLSVALHLQHSETNPLLMIVVARTYNEASPTTGVDVVVYRAGVSKLMCCLAT
jgi:hypothetical protein